jgi:hypothetical protein
VHENHQRSVPLRRFAFVRVQARGEVGHA